MVHIHAVRVCITKRPEWGPTRQEASMLREQEQYRCARIIQFPKRVSVTEPAFRPSIDAPDLNDAHLFEFAANAPATLAERFPHLTVLAIAAAVLLTAITAEIECLRGSGYFWR